MNSRTFLFTKPLWGVVFLPLVFMFGILLYSLSNEFNTIASILAVFTALILAIAIRWAFLRRIRLSDQGLNWVEPGKKYGMDWRDVRHFGKLTFRSFTFIYVSSENANPFEDPKRPILPGPRTFLFQYRDGAWTLLQNQILAIKPDLVPKNLKRA